MLMIVIFPFQNIHILSIPEKNYFEFMQHFNLFEVNLTLIDSKQCLNVVLLFLILITPINQIYNCLQRDDHPKISR